MSHERLLPGRGRIPHGVCLDACRYCAGPIAPPRRSFCGAVCVHEWKLRSNVTYMRRCVRKRDKGVCAVCGIDCCKLEKIRNGLVYRLRQTPPEQREQIRQSLLDLFLLRHVEGFLLDRLGPKDGVKLRSYWNADHILPVSAGGGLCGLGNLQTVCIPCHTKKHSRRKPE